MDVSACTCSLSVSVSGPTPGELAEATHRSLRVFAPTETDDVRVAGPRLLSVLGRLVAVGEALADARQGLEDAADVAAEVRRCGTERT